MKSHQTMYEQKHGKMPKISHKFWEMPIVHKKMLMPNDELSIPG